MYKLTPKAYEALCRDAIRQAAEFEYYLKKKSVYTYYEFENLGRLIGKIHPAYIAYRDSAIDNVAAIKSIYDMYDTGNALLAPAVAITVNAIERAYKEF
jgi:hypothetical protein